MDSWVNYSLLLLALVPRISQHLTLLHHQGASVHYPATDPNMEDVQVSEANDHSETQYQPFKLMDLAPEVRLLIYGHAMHNEGIQGSFPALLHVCQQIREEASPVYFRSERFPLVLQPQPHTEKTVFAFDLKTRDWFSIIGPERVNALRHVVFQFEPIEQAIVAAGGYSIDLSCGDASNWEYQVKIRHQWVYGSLKRELALIKKHVSPLFRKRPLLAAEFREEHIKMCTSAIQHAQDALDKFASTCGVNKHLKTTADALEELGGALVAVEKARFQHTSP